MELLHKIEIYLHVACGGTALVAGLIPMATVKGGRLHRRAGMVFYYAILGVAVTATAICLPRISEGHYQFLQTIAIFSFYLSYSGRRIIHVGTGSYQDTDWMVIGATIACTVGMFFLHNIVLLVFALLQLWLCALDIRFYGAWDEAKRKENREFIIKTHIGKMTGAYIATFTAFVVVNFHFEGVPFYIPWLAPTLIFLPFIRYWSRRYDRKQS